MNVQTIHHVGKISVKNVFIVGFVFISTRKIGNARNIFRLRTSFLVTGHRRLFLAKVNFVN
jgi:hypothetical protein